MERSRRTVADEVAELQVTQDELLDRLISDDPAHAWVRASWDEQQLDPRLPFTNETRKAGADG